MALPAPTSEDTALTAELKDLLANVPEDAISKFRLDGIEGAVIYAIRDTELYLGAESDIQAASNSLL